MGSISDGVAAGPRAAGSHTVDRIDERQAEAERWSAEELVRWGLEEFHPEVAIASSFGAEDVVLIDIAARAQKHFRVFTLDTDFLFDETYALIGQIEARYGIEIERCRSVLTPEEQARQHGEALWGREQIGRASCRGRCGGRGGT